ncbi:hypothetical protein HF086_011395 [Spodoptera exigua]|uniref:Uncharacterized protein n=1 Tax=Spodoptera exigua TaxID=7107 RepID=A0A922STC7_SPOEX|nr:hypothetical protein HF086_011395 [Spodoptera exigua]
MTRGLPKSTKRAYHVDIKNQENLSPDSEPMPITVEKPKFDLKQDLPTVTKIVSLVPDYSSDSTVSENDDSIHLNNNAELANYDTQILPISGNNTQRFRSFSSSSSSSSTSSSLSSSSSSSSSSSDAPEVSEDQQIIQQRACRNKNSVPNYNISPIYSDESDIDLSDDDPTIDYNSIPRKHIRRQNFLFERSTSDSSDSNSETNNIRRGRKRSRKN